jgi:nicotinate-nucleotide adenylyltransferase
VTGILGGTFDPPHLGHLALASEAAHRFGLGRVLLVPARIPPHKGAGVTPYGQRVEMLRAAAGGDPLLEVAELEPPGTVTCTVDLLSGLRRDGIEPLFITGSDALLDMPSWRSYPGFLDLARFAAGIRPGFDPALADPLVMSRVTLFDMPGMLISSSDLRTRFARGMPVRYLIPGSVLSFVARRGLYGCREGC